MGQTSEAAIPALTKAKSKLNDLTKVIDDARARLRQEAEATFMEACKELFAAHPKLQSFAWVQYAPYFNDGDACVFSVHEITDLEFGDVRFSGYEIGVTDSKYTKVGQHEVDEFDWDKRKTVKVVLDKYEFVPCEPFISGCDDEDPANVPEGFDMKAAIAALKDVQEIHSFIQSNDEMAEQAFGNHVKVIVTCDGVTTEDYDHD